ncbi:DEAD/DEAH box helicase family protein [Acinetobacter pittii]|uniref:DEAD/DEAH box helicase family protein n=1 Tax=Acinetobacter pittii TaxID=48296 RepID=UPI002D1ECE71|nr:DEAD/DEAH box helicase family protein [Acinetobacter pittii]MEB3850925.1 DEAD/DEAH box helicase family protein [Acinetobacter pittii]
MSFFNSFYDDAESIQINNIMDTYESLDAKSSHAALRPVQLECINLLDQKISQKDIILKLSTGSGKTTIGLLYLKYFGQKYEEPIVFLVPNLQLAEQVAREASCLGLPFTFYGQGDRYVEHDAMKGEMIIISTYDKFFNGLNTFQKYNIYPCAIVFDDAHSGVDIIKKQYTLSGEGDCYTELYKLFNDACKSYDSIEWTNLQNSNSSFEIPYWIWSDKIEDVISILEKYKENYKFSYPLVINDLALCRCVLSENKFEIASDIVNIKKSEPYAKAKHRLFMSATLSDYDNFIRTLDINPECLNSLVCPESDKGIGERMILVPSLVSTEFNKEKIISICKDFSDSYTVFVLTSSTPQAEIWTKEGATLLTSENISEELTNLKNSNLKNGLYVMAQRFEGLDLADDLCRILVIDEIPFGERLIDKYDSECLGHIGGQGKKNIFRIEQGMGRAVRSHVDYAVVLLAGNDLSSFIAHKQCREALSEETICQLDLGIKITRKVQSSSGDKVLILKDVISSCLTRDVGWKQTYAGTMKKIIKTDFNPNQTLIEVAKQERRYYESSFNQQYLENKESFNSAINKLEDSEFKAKLLENLARVVKLYDFNESQKIQVKARHMNSKLLKPNTLLPKKVLKESTPAGINIANLINEFNELNAIILQIKTLKDNFGFNDTNSKIIEKSFKSLGKYLGADSSNPEMEESHGPDVCWYLDNKVFVIEVKHNKIGALSKHDAGQLAVSTQWAKEHYLPLTTIIPVTVTDILKTNHDALYTDDTLIMNQQNVESLLNDLLTFYTSILEGSKTQSQQISTEWLCCTNLSVKAFSAI